MMIRPLTKTIKNCWCRIWNGASTFSRCVSEWRAIPTTTNASTHLRLTRRNPPLLVVSRMTGENSFGLSGSLLFRRRCHPSHGGDRSVDHTK
jgi:hypothetical protein